MSRPNRGAVGGEGNPFGPEEDFVPPEIQLTLDAQDESGQWHPISAVFGFEHGRSRVEESVIRLLGVEPKTIRNEKDKHLELRTSLGVLDILGTVDLVVRKLPSGAPVVLQDCLLVRSGALGFSTSAFIGLEDARKIKDDDQRLDMREKEPDESGAVGQVAPDISDDEKLDYSRATTQAAAEDIQEIARWAEVMADLGGIPLGPINTIEWQWEVPAFIKSRGGTDTFGFADEVIITTSDWRGDGATGNCDRLRAWTCLEWANECLPERWQRLLFPFLDHVATHVIASDEGSFESSSDRADSLGAWASPLKWTYDCRSLRVLLAPRFPGSQPIMEEGLIEFIDLVGWFCRTMRVPRAKAGINLSSSIYTVQRFEVLTHFTSEDIGGATFSYVFKPFMLLRDKPLCETQYNCWQKLFSFCTVTTCPNAFQPSQRTETKADRAAEGSSVFGRGLEMSFDLMMSLAAVELQTLVNGGVAFTGYSVAVVPTAVSDRGDAAQFHLITDDAKNLGSEATRGQLNPYAVDLGRRLLIEDGHQFRTMRCFLGWCERACINLGTPGLPASVQYSGSKEKGRSLVLDGYETLAQLGVSNPFSAVVGLQTNFKYTSHRRQFTPMSGFQALLSNTAIQVAAIYDTGNRCGWLVPKLNILLHMAHAYVLSYPGQKDNPVPFVKGDENADKLIAALSSCGDKAIHGGRSSSNHGDSTLDTQTMDSLVFRQLMFGLNTNLLSTVPALQKSKGRQLYGFEFMDVVETPGRGTCMKAVTLSPAGRHWLDLVNDADAVVVCSGIGQVITPASRSLYPNPDCNNLPSGHDYLAATVPCLAQLARRKGGSLDSASSSQRVRLSEDSYWELRGDPFHRCAHGMSRTDTCWKRLDLRQRLVTKSPFGRDKPAAAQQRTIPSNGAVVFG